MILQNMAFPKKGICDEAELYYHVEQGDARQENGQLFLAQGTTVSFLTYFNSFSGGKWQEYTQIEEVVAVLAYRGGCRISLFRTKLANDGLVRELVCETAGERQEKGEETMPFTLDGTDWVYYLSVEASEDMWISGGGYHAESAGRQRPVDIALGICTYRREEYVQKTLDTLRTYILDAPESALYSHIHVFVSDNGNTLPLEDLNEGEIHVVYNKNAGGSGGFGRCMLEALRLREQRRFTHVLLMDDDIVLEPEALFRTYQFLTVLKRAYWKHMLGGALLRLDVPYIQHANGETWNAGRVGYTKRGYDLRRECDVVKNEERLPIGYNGWWYCCIPMEGASGISFPLPVFVHVDDMEYGLRFGGNILTLNGVGVWHDAFDNRRASSMAYYDMRNTLICTAIHRPEEKKAGIVKMICRHMVAQMLRYRYDDQLLTMRAVRDFCEGVDFLIRTDPVELNSQVMQMGYRQEDVSIRLHELQVEKYYTGPEAAELYKEKPFSVKEQLTINGWLLPARRKCIPVPFGAHPRQMYRYKKVLLFDPDTGKGFEVERKWFQLFVTLGRCIRMGWLVQRKYKKAVKDYQERSGGLITREFWEKYLEQ